jgi:hypothetical protein
MTGQKAILLRDITAAELAMESLDGSGYPPGHVIGPAGSEVSVLSADGNLIEVTDFREDPYAAGFVPAAVLDFRNGTR